jgi:hypothetical protein
MADKPILFSAPMISALMTSNKTQTRRVLKHGWAPENRIVSLPDGPNKGLRVVPHAAGDRLWVREAWRTGAGFDDLPPRNVPKGAHIAFEADADRARMTGKLRPGMFMPRWASRLTLIVENVKIERLQDISAADSIAEGVECATCAAIKASACGGKGCFASLAAFRDLWNSINGPGAWEANPWVSAYTFRVIRANIDQVQQ